MKSILTLTMVFLMLSLTSCHRRPLDEGCNVMCKIPIGTIWSKSEILPQNVTALFFNKSDGALVLEHRFENINSEIQTYAEISYGEYSVLIFNEMRGQVSGALTEGTDNLNSIRFMGLPDPYVKMQKDQSGFIRQPEPIALALIHNVKIDPALESKQLIGIVPEQIISNMQLEVKVKGLNNALMPALADFYNLSSGYQVSRLNNLDLPASMQFTMEKGSDNNIYASFPLFGTLLDRISIIGYDSKPLLLTIRFMLKDKNRTVVQRSLDVTRLLKFTSMKNGSVKLCLNIDLMDPLPDVEPEKSGNSGFGSQIVDWDYVDVPIQLR